MPREIDGENESISVSTSSALPKRRPLCDADSSIRIRRGQRLYPPVCKSAYIKLAGAKAATSYLKRVLRDLAGELAQSVIAT
jgi:hypothetical protein